ncbi:hypothetical protein [Nocardia sp. NPDC049149]|uniref:hypothetical protein n=1 Tax=Nocardia sp. NPDC049149 TaxID=3364315 RepID=UPI003713A37B
MPVANRSMSAGAVDLSSGAHQLVELLMGGVTYQAGEQADCLLFVAVEEQQPRLLVGQPEQLLREHGNRAAFATVDDDLVALGPFGAREGDDPSGDTVSDTFSTRVDPDSMVMQVWFRAQGSKHSMGKRQI